MINAAKMRKLILDNSLPLIKHKLWKATGGKVETDLVDGNMDTNAAAEIWELLVPIIQSASDPVPAVWKGKDTQAKVDAVLLKVSKGIITPEEGKRLLAVVSLGVDIVELPKLLEKLEGSIE